MTTQIQGRSRVLIVCPAFFGYEKQIAEEFTRQGHEVVLLDERPSNSPLMRALLRIRPSLALLQVERHYRRAWRRLRLVPWNVVLVIKAEVVPSWFLSALRDANPAARVVGYTFDSLSNSPRYLRMRHHLDRCFTFDPVDAINHDMTYLPLFHAPAFSGPARPRTTDVCFIGTLHSDRYRVVRHATAGFKAHLFFFVQARWYFFVLKYLSRQAAAVAWSEVNFRAMNLSEVAESFVTARCVIDIQRNGQRGLTMRTFEALASGACLVTSNSSITSEPFFSADRIFVFDEEDPASAREQVNRAISTWVEDPQWVEREMGPYSLTRWVQRLVHAGAQS